ncbi:ABC transporter ATP-binding protein [Cetobacterium somerae]|uniref:ABC transporter ATP-binding protein n=1 Tax=Cetobacterium sp. NK01 TaxID=2993530 RepID=UPI0021164EB5|nr:ABC transporter ATP-binding protein [Cetobacterium sp. NK01]MCQ8211050.1 ABC transporter ATP-binding protein [Cetobacterium sp. NK01]
MIEIKEVSKSFSAFSLKNINISIKEGEFIGVLGQSGSGKTTLLNIVSGLDKEFQGEILIDGKSPSRMIKDGKIAMVFQKDLLLPHLNVWENIAFGLKIKKISKDEIEKRVREVLLEMDLVGKEKRFPNELSGGEKQRVSIARAIVTRPKLLLMDEPFSALDFNLRDKMQKMVKKLHERLKVTIIFVTHDREEAFYLSTRIGVMFKGELLDYGTPKDLYNEPKNVYTAKLLGVENIFLKEKFESIFKCKIKHCKFVALRGKSIKIVKDSNLKGKVEEITYKMGGHWVVVSLGDEKITLVEENEVLYEKGDEISLSYNDNEKILIGEQSRC